MAMMTPAHRELLGEDGIKVVEALQASLPTLIDVALVAKQLHWNLRGSRFKSLHEQLDELIDDVRLDSDAVAERITTLGEAADGRSSTVAQDSGLAALQPGFLGIDETVETMCDALVVAIKGLRDGQKKTADIDPVTEDLLIGMAASLEKHLWMFRSQIEEA